MKCSACGFENSKVVDSRIVDSGASTRRRRECEKCAFRFTTFERLQSAELTVAKKDGSREPYDREKLEKAIMIACGKRPVPFDEVSDRLSELEEKWGKKNPVTSSEIGEDVVSVLREVDDIAFIRFASVYKEFEDIASFKKALEGI